MQQGKHHPCRFSVEFYPPRSAEGEAKLDEVHRKLAALDPDFFSVTYGAGGSTREGTRRLVLKYQEQGSSVAPHLSFGGASEEEIHSLLQAYLDAGISRLVALRGDIPSGSGAASEYRYAEELVGYIRQHFGDAFHIEVACYPEIHPDARSYSEDVDYFRAKVAAGADSAITQYFYNADAYLRFRDRCEKSGIDIPIVPGIMPITNYANLSRFSAKCGAEIPRWLCRRLEDLEGDPEAQRDLGLDVVTELCERLLQEGAPGLHFYSMNLFKPVSEIWQRLSLDERRQV